MRDNTVKTPRRLPLAATVLAGLVIAVGGLIGRRAVSDKSLQWLLFVIGFAGLLIAFRASLALWAHRASNSQ